MEINKGYKQFLKTAPVTFTNPDVIDSIFNVLGENRRKFDKSAFGVEEPEGYYNELYWRQYEIILWSEILSKLWPSENWWDI